MSARVEANRFTLRFGTAKQFYERVGRRPGFGSG